MAKEKKKALGSVRNEKVSIMLDTRRTLCADLNAIAELEEKYGSYTEALKRISEGSVSAMRFFLWALLQHEDDTLTERQVGAMITMQNMDEVTDALQKAISAGAPDSDEAPAATAGGTPDPT